MSTKKPVEKNKKFFARYSPAAPAGRINGHKTLLEMLGGGVGRGKKPLLFRVGEIIMKPQKWGEVVQSVLLAHEYD